MTPKRFIPYIFFVWTKPPKKLFQVIAHISRGWMVSDDFKKERYTDDVVIYIWRLGILIGLASRWRKTGGRES